MGTAYFPARRQASGLVVAALASVGLSILALDRPIADWAHTLAKPDWCVWLTHIADLPGPLCLIAAGAVGVAWLTGWRPGRLGQTVLVVCLATLAAIAAKDMLKFAFGRPWPETWTNHNPSWIGTHTYGFNPFHGGAGWASFPSGHTTTITAPCAALWLRVPKAARPLLALLPCLVVIGLVGADYHFLSDCIAGAWLGLAWAAGAASLTGSARQGA